MQRLNKKGVSFCTRTTHDDNAITNAIEIYDTLRYFSYQVYLSQFGTWTLLDMETFAVVQLILLLPIMIVVWENMTQKGFSLWITSSSLGQWMWALSMQSDWSNIFFIFFSFLANYSPIRAHFSFALIYTVVFFPFL